MTESYTPFLLRAVNHLGDRIASRSRRKQPLEAGALIREARRRTGLADFGAPGVYEPLDRLTQSLETEAALSFIGRIATRDDLLHLLTNRLSLQADRARYPGIAGERVDRPLFIMGLPRSGNTLLHQLLAQDGAHRVPLAWQVRRPSPPPALVGPAQRKRHIKKTAREFAWFYRLAPRFRKIHPLGACLPQECIEILSHSFTSSRFHTSHFVPTYQAWLDQQDMEPAYAWHKRFLEHMQWRAPRARWVLKAPAHLFALDALLRTYPDAVIVQTHRDPRAVMGSMLSMTKVIQSVFSDRIDSARMAQEVSRRWGAMIEQAMQTRARANQVSFIDVDYTELANAPLRTIERIYRRLDQPLTRQARTRMRAWLRRNPGHRHGAHRYSLAEFGLDADEQAQRFERYLSAFDVPSDDPSRKAKKNPSSGAIA